MREQGLLCHDGVCIVYDWRACCGQSGTNLHQAACSSCLWSKNVNVSLQVLGMSFYLLVDPYS